MPENLSDVYDDDTIGVWKSENMGLTTIRLHRIQISLYCVVAFLFVGSNIFYLHFEYKKDQT